MVRKYDKKSNRQEWNENDMANAIDDVIQKKMGCKKAASNYIQCSSYHSTETNH
jgi:hypothetical protein